MGMNLPGGLPHVPIYPISAKDAAMERVPYFIPFEPLAAIAALGTGEVNMTVSWQDFVCTKYGFTSPTVGFPAAPGRWKIQIQDVGGSRNFQPQGFNITAAIGANAGQSDSPAVDFPVPWVFMEKTTIRVTFEELAGFANMPQLLLIGYLTNWGREATAAQAHQELALKALRRQAGEAP